MEASSPVIRPGCASMSTLLDETAAMLVPGSTGSIMVSPWTLTIPAPNLLASLASLSISPFGVCVISTPGITWISQCFSASSQSFFRTFNTNSRFPGPTWSVIAMTSYPMCTALRISSIGDRTPSLKKVCV